MTDVLVVGAGIGGLTLASALTRSAPEVSVRVVERDRDVQSRAQGYSVALRTAHGLAVLDRLGLRAKIDRVARPVRELRLLTSSGRPLRSYRPAGAGAPEALAAVPRAALREVLLGSLPPGTVSWNRRAVDFAQREGRAGVRLEDGEVLSADVVVACDGARSLARRRLLGQDLRHVGLARIGGLADHIEHPLLADGPTMTIGRGCSTLLHPFAGERLVWSFTSHAAEGVSARLSPAELLRRAADATARWHDPVPAVIAATEPEDVDVRDLYDVPPPTRARVGRIVLLGDASHAMTPFRGLGANMAMVDAVELADALAAAGAGGVDAALERYERTMLPRNRGAVRRSHAAARSVHETSRVRTLVRDARLRIAGRFSA